MMDIKHEALVRFAAEKVGWVLRGSNDYTKPLHKNSKDFPGTWVEDWDNKGPHPRWEGPDGELVYLCGCDKSTHGMPDVYSPDLFFKGLAVIPPHLLWYLNGDSYHRSIAICNDGQGDMRGKVGKVWWEKPADIPLSFWQAWAEAEGVELK